MKITFDIDCTPEELRRAFGLPDVKPMQDAVVAKMAERLLDAVANQPPDAMLKAWLPYWLPFMGQSPEQIQRLMAAVFGGSFNGSPKTEQ